MQGLPKEYGVCWMTVRPDRTTYKALYANGTNASSAGNANDTANIIGYELATQPVWIIAGTIALAGPYAMNGTQIAVMSEQFDFRLQGIEFEASNRVAIQKVPCAAPVTD